MSYRLGSSYKSHNDSSTGFINIKDFVGVEIV